MTDDEKIAKLEELKAAAAKAGSQYSLEQNRAYALAHPDSIQWPETWAHHNCLSGQDDDLIAKWLRGASPLFLVKQSDTAH